MERMVAWHAWSRYWLGAKPRVAHCSRKVFEERLMRLKIFLALCVGPLTLFSIFYFPGLMSNDSYDQYGQALSFNFTDWHPPVMAALWSVLNDFIPGPAGMLLLQGGLYWGGVWLLSVADPSRKEWARWGLFFVTPLTTSLIGIVWKDVLMGGVLFFYVALFYWCINRGTVSRRHLVIFACLLLVAATLRQNAIFALPPLIYLLLRAVSKIRIRYAMLASLVGAGVLVGVSGVLNYGFLKATRMHAEASVMVFDLAGISVRTGQDSLGQLIGQKVDHEHCYQTRYWDPYAWGECKYVYEEIKRAGFDKDGSLASLWVSSIAAHPAAYLRHRMRFFGEFLLRPAYVGVLPAEGELAGYPYKPSGGARLNARILQLMEQSGFLCTPLLSLLVSAAVLVVVMIKYRRHKSASFLVCISSSSLLYGFSFLIAGVSNDFRYAFWLSLAALSGAAVFILDIISGKATQGGV